MRRKNIIKFNDIDQKKRAHDIQASIRFLENLHSEISLATNIKDINDPVILKKFSEIIEIIKKEIH